MRRGGSLLWITPPKKMRGKDRALRALIKGKRIKIKCL